MVSYRIILFKKNSSFATDGPNADSTMQFSLLSTSRLAPVFSLSFIVSDGPPTFVDCTVNGSGISTELSRVIMDGTGFITRVTVTNLTEAGNYQCDISNDRAIDGTINDVTAMNSTSSLVISGWCLMNYYISLSPNSIRYSNWFQCYKIK